ncbi:2Fe-2S iron-sulfur cluster binding domain-containing protein [Brevibacillus sp. NRS-1366]|uniref:2Fe-2S iron-sulfur cluster binding domain-containing protein n=1 Tax=Brevibacillus sp. NRS-1366 TaxID=3233899 RepID=UPI003D1FE1A3
MFQITLREKRFECKKEHDLLQAARRHLVNIPFGCCRGGCGMCKIKVLEGEYMLGLSSREVLPGEDRERGYSLACKTYPLSNMVVELVDP